MRPMNLLNVAIGLTLVATSAESQNVIPQDRSARSPNSSPPGPLVHTTLQRPTCHCTDQTTNRLIIWTAVWCKPCQRFWQDFQSDVEFRRAIESRFHLHIVDADQHPDTTRAAQIDAIPVFETPHRRINGYQGKAWLLDQLTRTDATKTDTTKAEQPAATSSPTQNAPPAPRDPRPSDGAPSVDEREAPPSDPAMNVPSAGPTGPAKPSPTPTSTNPASQKKPRSPFLSQLIGLTGKAFPFALSALQVLGILGGTAATGGIGALALRAGWGLLKRRLRRRRSASHQDQPTGMAPAGEGGETVTARTPFPRRLDEARELLALRQSEGRVAVLDALRGMFLDDELQKLTASTDEQSASTARKLRNAIDTRIDQVAPLSTTID